MTAGDERSHRLHERRSCRSLDSLLASGSEIYRSLWDENSILADFDIEYVNFDHSVEASLEPGRVFALQEPVPSEHGREMISIDLSEYGDSPYSSEWIRQREDDDFDHRPLVHYRL